MIVVDSAAVVDALTASEGTDGLRAFLASEELNAPDLSWTSRSCHRCAD